MSEPDGQAAALDAEAPRIAWRLRWSALAAGALLTAAIWLLLHTLGLALGLIGAEPADPESLRAVGFGRSAFAMLAPLIALFVGGLVTARAAALDERRSALVHATMLWALTALAGALVVGVVAAAMVGGARPVRGAVAVARGGDPLANLGLDMAEVLQPTNTRLAAAGLPAVTAPQVRAAAGDLIPRTADDPPLDRAALVRSLMANTGLPGAEAEQIAGRIERQVNERLARQRTAGKAPVERAGRGSWAAFFGLLFGFASAAAGAVVGASRRQRRTREAHPVELPQAHAPARP